jgi:CRISPR-associated endoribonuclease Cas6
LEFRFYPLRFSFVALEPVLFPVGTSANILRGSFGLIFRRIACCPECPGARVCEKRAECPYARVFEPTATGPGPSGLADWPRPFVFRAAHLDGRTVRPGERFHFDLHLFDLRRPAISCFVQAFSELTREGLGPRRGRVSLADVSQLSLDHRPALQLFDGENILHPQGTPPEVLSLAPPPATLSSVTIRFVTPTELKSAQTASRSRQSIPAPEFAILAARARDRISTLGALYGDGPLALDFRAFGQRAAAVRILRSELEHVDVHRRSSRTGQIHPIGGFVGEVEYEGDLTEFVPYLRAARWTGVGRQTAWGKGAIEIA